MTNKTIGRRQILGGLATGTAALGLSARPAWRARAERHSHEMLLAWEQEKVRKLEEASGVCQLWRRVASEAFSEWRRRPGLSKTKRASDFEAKARAAALTTAERTARRSE